MDSKQSATEEARVMRPKTFVFWLAPVAIAGLLGPAPAGIFAQASQPAAPKTGSNAVDYECKGNSCTVSLEEAAAAAAKSEAGAPAKPYDWKASFKEYKVGKVPRTA